MLDIEDAVGSKVTALVGRGLPRDLIDVAVALQRYSREQLMTLAFVRDPGLRVLDFILAAHALDAVSAEAFAAYGLNISAVAELRGRFADWPRGWFVKTATNRVFAQVHLGRERPTLFVRFQLS